ncbi:lipoprotein releasing system transmembrane protein LolC [Vibrio astriarenae]|nr:lipoprotein releasing system transmembrane protein LolC [Vibrio sp. C7]
MFHPVSLFIGLRYLRGRSGDRFGRFVSFMSTAGITIGVMSLVTVLSVMNGFENQLKGRMLGVLPQAVVSQEGGKTSTTEGVPDFISSLTPYQAQPIARSEAVIQSSEGLGVAMMVGIESGLENPVAQHLVTGHMSHLNAGEYGVFLGHSLARELNVSMGDKVRLMVTSASQFTPLGRIPSNVISLWLGCSIRGPI